MINKLIDLNVLIGISKGPAALFECKDEIINDISPGQVSSNTIESDIRFFMKCLYVILV